MRVTTREGLDKAIEVWHTMPEDVYYGLGQPCLSEFLGWSWEEYKQWLEMRGYPQDFKENDGRS